VKNLSVLNVKLLNELDQDKRFHLLKALCLTVETALSLKTWEYMLGREDGAWYWNNYGLFFSSLHALIPTLNALQKHVSEIEPSFTGRLIYLEGKSERYFLERLHLATRFVHFENHYFVYGGKGAHRNLAYHIQDKNAKGVRVDLAYDGDSNFSTQIMRLQEQAKIRRVFRFERDFEAAFPPEILASAITAYLKQFKDESAETSIKDVNEMLAEPKPFVKVVEERYLISIDKPYLGELLAIELLKLSRRDERVLQGAGLIRGTELSRFLRFVMDWSEEVSAAESEPEEDITFDP